MASLNDLRKERLDLAGQAKAIADTVRNEGRNFKEDEIKSFDLIQEKVRNIDTEIKSIEETQARMEQMGAIFGSSQDEVADPGMKSDSERYHGAKTVGQAFVKEMAAKGMSLKAASQRGLSIDVKANTDTHVTGGPDGFYEPWLVDVEKSGGVRPVREQPIVGDLISWGSMGGQAVRYLVYPTTMLEGRPGMVNEGGTKPQVHLLEPRWEQDGLSEVAAWFKITDDMAEDLPFVVSEINRQLQWEFTVVESEQLLRGNGTHPNLRGILTRSGIQHAATATDPRVQADNLFKAIQLVQTATGFAADGIVIHPTDYQALRLMKNNDGHYFAGGIFSGPGAINPGNGLNWQQPLWGVRTVVSTTATPGQPIVGAWKAGATGYRKGGLKVESTNSHENDFTNDRITIRMREKLGLAVRYPGAFVVMDQTA